MAARFLPQLLGLCILSVPIRCSSVAMPGAPFDVPTNRCDVQQAARFAVAAYNAAASRDVYDYKLMAVVSSQTQVVEGLNYILIVELGQTWCAQAGDAETCPLQVNGKRLLCCFTVWTVPWEGRVLLTENRCIESPFRPSRYRRFLGRGTR